MYKYILLVLLSLLVSQVITAQLTPEQAKEELAKRGVDDDEVARRMKERGYDIDKIDPSNPAEVAKAEMALKEVLAEIEKEKQGQAGDDVQESTKVKDDVSADEQLEQIENVTNPKDQAVERQIEKEEEAEAELEPEYPPAKVYGQEIFRSQNLKLYRQTKDIKPPDDYILGVGDKLAVAIWGYTEENLVFEINQDGYIKPTGMPRIYLKGLRYGDVKKLLLSRFKKAYRFRPTEFEVTLNSGRTIHISILGEVFNYGTFTLPAMNTAFNALVAAGGPNDIGSVRRIEVMRGHQKKTLDVYKYLQDPSVSSTYYLQENDVIYVPVAEKLVTIQGAVKRPFRYELLPSENLIALVKYAGGLKENALKNNVQITRYQNDQEVLIDVNLKNLMDQNRDVVLMPGDVITIQTIERQVENIVSVSGPVQISGQFALNKGERISDMLKRAILLPDAILNTAFLKRLNTDYKTYKYIPVNLKNILQNHNTQDNLILEPKDQLLIFSKKNYSDVAQITTQGAVRNPGEFDYDFGNTIRLTDVIFLSEGLKRDASGIGYVERINPNNPKQNLFIAIDIKKALADPSSDYNIALQPNDKIKIYSMNDFTDEAKIEIQGAVRAPGEISYSPTLTLTDVLIISGGLSISADPRRIDIYRVDLKGNVEERILAATIQVDSNLQIVDGSEFRLQPYDQIVVRDISEFGFQKTVTIDGEVFYPGPYAILRPNETVSQLIERAGGLTPKAFMYGATLIRAGDVGHIVLEMDEIINKKNKTKDIILKEGDRIIIPEKNNLVTITGAVNLHEAFSTLNTNKINVAYEPGKNAKYYIDQYAGGLAENSNRKDVRVIDATGKVRKAKTLVFFRKYPEVKPGSTIVVGSKPAEEQKREREKSETDWGEVVSNTIAQATAVLSLILLLQNVN